MQQAYRCRRKWFPKERQKNSQFSVRRNHLVFQSRNLWSKGESWLAFTPVLISCCQMRRCVSLRLKARLELEKNHEDQPGAIAEVAKMVPTFLGSTEYRINGRATKYQDWKKGIERRRFLSIPILLFCNWKGGSSSSSTLLLSLLETLKVGSWSQMSSPIRYLSRLD